jgi:hypothetical protein
MAPAFGFLHQLQIPRGTELAAEVAGIARVDVDHIRCPQGQGILQFDPVVDVDPGDLLRFHRATLVSGDFVWIIAHNLGKEKYRIRSISEYGAFLSRIGNYFEHFLHSDYTNPDAAMEAVVG